MRREVLTAAAAAAFALLLTTGCDKIFGINEGGGSNGTGDPPLLQWSISIGPQTQTLLADDGYLSITDSLQVAWEEQQAMRRFEEAAELANRIVRYEPFDIRLMISLVYAPDIPVGRPSVDGDGVGGFLSCLLAEVSSRGLDYRVIGHVPEIIDYEFDLCLQDGSITQALLVTKGFCLRHFEVEEEVIRH